MFFALTYRVAGSIPRPVSGIFQPNFLSSLLSMSLASGILHSDIFLQTISALARLIESKLDKKLGWKIVETGRGIEPATL